MLLTAKRTPSDCILDSGHGSSVSRARRMDGARKVQSEPKACLLAQTAGHAPGRQGNERQHLGRARRASRSQIWDR